MQWDNRVDTRWRNDVTKWTRRDVLASVVAGGAAVTATGWATLGITSPAMAAEKKGAGMRFGLVTYQWGKDWDLPTLLANLVRANTLGVELRTTHKHGVEPTLTANEREVVRKRFVDAGVTCVGIGSDERFDNPDPAVVKKALEATKAFIQLSHDIGGSGVKVKPDRFWPDVPREKTITQIGKALNELGEFAQGFGQQVRLEVHGQCQELPTIKAIMDIADHSSVGVCWNSNPTDLKGGGLKHNFQLVSQRFGATSHIHVLDSPSYPFAELLELYVGIDYEGWLLLEEGTVPADPAAALAEQKELFDKTLAAARQRAG